MFEIGWIELDYRGKFAWKWKVFKTREGRDQFAERVQEQENFLKLIGVRNPR